MARNLSSAAGIYNFISHRIHGAGIYANIWGILMGSMLPYMAAPWILWVWLILDVCAEINDTILPATSATLDLFELRELEDYFPLRID